MKRAFLLFFIAVASLVARAQCPLHSNVSILGVGCDGFFVEVSFFNGGMSNGVYSIWLTTNDGSYNGADSNPNGFVFHVPWTAAPVITSVNVYAFDNVCTVVGTWTGTLTRPVMDLQYSVALDCSTGLRTLRWTNADIACGGAGAHTYLVSGVGGSTGTVASAFTQESASVWRYNTQLPWGGNTINFGIDVTSTGYTGYNCGGSLQCWALSTTGLVAIPTPYVTPGDCGVNFLLKAFLDGAYTSGALMSDALRVANLVPTTEPYTALGYSYTGSPTGLTIAPAVLAVTGSNAIVDWVVVELRDANTPSTVVYSKPALLQRDGDVVDTDGAAYLNFPVAAGNYHVALRHRNHLGVMTGAPQALTTDPGNTTIDLRSQSVAAWGSNARVLKSAAFCLWAGDATGDGVVKYTGSGNDRDLILQAIGGSVPTSTVNSVYDRRDLNLDGMIKYTGLNNDGDVILRTIGGSVPTATRTQQLP